MRRGFVIGCLVVILAGLAAPARAGLVVYLQDTTVPSGGYGIMNIWLGSTDPTNDVFNTYSLQLQIAGTNFLEFAPNPTEPSTATPQTQNYAYLSAANYIFNQNGPDSLNGQTDSNGGAPVPGTSNTQFIANDQSFSYSTYAPPNNMPGSTLLASLVLYGAVTNPGEMYTVSVVSGSNTSFTVYDPNTGMSTNVSYSVGSASGYNGMVTIGASAVPEPASIILGLTGLAFVAGVARFGRIRRQG